eukprot:CAMPEP_0119268240 /NCGR_PEP_ID=MMETSP1329-20130426/6087_1 /TAXON_ID=114041 /ORGANISM="Genus nov. species nov., Strain RCC1024" /LENGTH=303 /DNA_ID=CAMNT_0007268203 /DNA_START=234 /DNA_END=1142 /DNA_ORIENTATION=-
MKLASCLLLLGVARGRVAARAALGNATRGAPRGRRVAVLLFGQIFHTHNSFTPRAAAGGFAGTPRTRGWACKAFSSTREHLLEPLRGRGFAVSAFVAAASPGGCDAFVESGPPAEWAVLDARRRLCEWLTGGELASSTRVEADVTGLAAYGPSLRSAQVVTRSPSRIGMFHLALELAIADAGGHPPGVRCPGADDATAPAAPRDALELTRRAARGLRPYYFVIVTRPDVLPVWSVSPTRVAEANSARRASRKPVQSDASALVTRVEEADSGRLQAVRSLRKPRRRRPGPAEGRLHAPLREAAA